LNHNPPNCASMYLGLQTCATAPSLMVLVKTFYVGTVVIDKLSCIGIVSHLGWARKSQAVPGWKVV
jgi:hypothetical protein